jgi:hypothetical protein
MNNALWREIPLQQQPQPASPRLGMTSMAIAHPSYCADGEWAKAQLRPHGLLSLRPKRLTILVFVLAMGLGGCARNSAHREFGLAQRETRAIHVHSPSRPHIRTERRREPNQATRLETHQPAELRVRRPDAALLAPQAAPNCEFKRADVKAVDPEEWARLKTEFERQCYQDAEKAARDRLSQLQASGTCEIERVPQQSPLQ